MSSQKRIERKLVDEISLKAQKAALVEEKKRVEELMYNDKLDKEQKDFLVAAVCQDVDDDIASRQPYLESRIEILDMYEGKKQPKSDPFPNCSNVQTMLVAMTTELLHARLYPLAFNENLSYWIPQEKSDIESSENISKFMEWANRRCGFKDFVDDYTTALILEGTAITKILWEEQWQWVQRRIPKPASISRKLLSKIKEGLSIDMMQAEPDYEVKYEYIKIEHARPVLVSLDDIGFPPEGVPGSNEEDLDHIWHRTRPRYSDLQLLEERGYFENVKKLKDRVEGILVNEGDLGKARADAEGSNYPVYKKIAVERRQLEQIEWYGKVYIEGEGLLDCIVWVEKQTKTFLGIMPLLHLSRKCRRPFVIAQLIRRANRLYGKTLLEFIKELQKEIDTIHNQRLDAGTMNVVPPIFFRAASGIEPEEIQVRPGVMVPLDDINDVRVFQFPNNALVSFQEERILMELVEKVSSIGSYQSGQESDINRTKATARGTMAIIAQGEQRFQTLAKRIKGPVSRIQVKMLEAYQENIPPGMSERVLGEDGKELFPKGLTAEDLIGQYDNVHGEDATGGMKLMQKEANMLAYQAFTQNPLVMANPVGLWELSARVLEDNGFRDPSKIIGPKPEQMQMQKDLATTIRFNIDEIKQGRMPKTLPNENPAQVLAALMAYLPTPEALMLEPEKRALLELRIERLRMEMVNMNIGAASMAQVAEGMRNARLTGSVEGVPGGANQGMGAVGPVATGNPPVPGTTVPGQEPTNEEAAQPGQPA